MSVVYSGTTTRMAPSYRILKNNLIFMAVVFSLSPLFCSFLGLNGNIVYLSLMGGALLFCLRKIRYKFIYILFFIYVFISSLLFSLRWQEFGLIFYPVYFAVAFFISTSFDKSDLIQIAKIFTLALNVILVGAIVGFIYRFLGGEALLEIKNPDGRVASLFLSTMTNWYVGSIIRPSGIFDEPGALSFITCAVCSLRTMCKLDKRTTWIMLAMGLITLSVAHVIYCVLFFLSSKIRLRGLLYALPVGLCILISAISFGEKNELYDGLDSVFLSRFEVVDGKISGDNRSDLLTNAYNIVNDYGWLWGGAASCVYNSDTCNDIFPPFGENILSPAALTGIIVSAPYYMLLIYLLRVSVRNRQSLHLLGFMLLLTQRPYLFSFGYSMLIVLVISSLIIFSRREVYDD